MRKAILVLLLISKVAIADDGMPQYYIKNNLDKDVSVTLYLTEYKTDNQNVPYLFKEVPSFVVKKNSIYSIEPNDIDSQYSIKSIQDISGNILLSHTIIAAHGGHYGSCALYNGNGAYPNYFDRRTGGNVINISSFDATHAMCYNTTFYTD